MGTGLRSDSAKRESTKQGPQGPDRTSGKVAFDTYIPWHGEGNNAKFTLHSTLMSYSNKQTEGSFGKPTGKEGCQEVMLCLVVKTAPRKRRWLQWNENNGNMSPSLRRSC